LLSHNRYRRAGGEERHVALLDQGLREAGVDVRCYERCSPERPSAVGRVALATGMTYRPSAARLLGYVLSEWRPDVVHFHNLLPLLTPAALREAKRSGAAVVLTLHNYRFACPAGTLVRRGGNLSRVTKGFIAGGFAFGLLVIPAALVESRALSIGFLLAASMSGIACGNMLAIPKIGAPDDQVALWTGVQNCIGNIGGVLAPIITGYLIARTGSYVTAFFLVAAILVVGAVSYLFVVPPLSGERANAAQT
jgi:glycosyltransferase involved in cell wall biosynthesis